MGDWTEFLVLPSDTEAQYPVVMLKNRCPWIAEFTRNWPLCSDLQISYGEQRRVDNEFSGFLSSVCFCCYFQLLSWNPDEDSFWNVILWQSGNLVACGSAIIDTSRLSFPAQQEEHCMWSKVRTINVHCRRQLRTRFTTKWSIVCALGFLTHFLPPVGIRAVTLQQRKLRRVH